jgi:hypothetical protein
MVVKPGSATRTCSSGRICYYNSAWSRPKLERRPFKLRDSCRPISEQTRGKYQISKDRLNPDALAEPKLRCNRTTHAFRILQFPASLPQNPPLQHPSQPSHSLAHARPTMHKLAVPSPHHIPTAETGVAVGDGGQLDTVTVAMPHPVEHWKHLERAVGQSVVVVGWTAARSHPQGSTTKAVHSHLAVSLHSSWGAGPEGEMGTDRLRCTTAAWGMRSLGRRRRTRRCCSMSPAAGRCRRQGARLA